MVSMDVRAVTAEPEPVLEGAPETGPAIAARYRECSVAPGARDVVGARLQTRGMVRIGRGWWPYRGHEVTLPTHGYFREMRARAFCGSSTPGSPVAPVAGRPCSDGPRTPRWWDRTWRVATSRTSP